MFESDELSKYKALKRNNESKSQWVPILYWIPTAVWAPNSVTYKI